MKKTVIVVLLVLFSSLIYGKENNKKEIYISKKHGFSLEIPMSWKNRYEVDEYKDGITVYYVKKDKKIGLFDIVCWGKEAEWNELNKEEKESIPSKKLGILNEQVYVWPWLVYEGEDEAESDKEYKKMKKEVEKVVDSFEEIKKAGGR